MWPPFSSLPLATSIQELASTWFQPAHLGVKILLGIKYTKRFWSYKLLPVPEEDAFWGTEGGTACMWVHRHRPVRGSRTGWVSSYIPKTECVLTISKNFHLSIQFVSTEERVVPIEVCRSKLSKYLQGVVFRCDKCTFTCSSDESLQQHIEKHNELKPYKCQLCYYETKHTEELDSHLRDEHKVPGRVFLRPTLGTPVGTGLVGRRSSVWSCPLWASQRRGLNVASAVPFFLWWKKWEIILENWNTEMGLRKITPSAPAQIHLLSIFYLCPFPLVLHNSDDTTYELLCHPLKMLFFFFVLLNRNIFPCYFKRIVKGIDKLFL